VTATCETDLDANAQNYYSAMVHCTVKDADGNLAASGTDSDVDGWNGYIQVVLTFTGVPGATYTATASHSAVAIMDDYIDDGTLGPRFQNQWVYYDPYNFGLYEGTPAQYDGSYEWFGPGPEQRRLPSTIHTGNTTATKTWPCFAQLKYRAVTPALGISIGNHSFWWIQDSAGKQYIIDGGPQNAGCYINCGYLVDWVTPGTVGHYPEDQIGAGTWFDSGTSPAVCTQVDALETAARNWPQAQTTYFVPGPNSNTFAHAMATSGNFAATQPPSATGW